MEKDNNKKKKIIIIVISIIIILVLALAISYAYFSTQLAGSDQIVKVGTLDLVLDETSEGISIDNAVGISDSEGLSLNGSTFELRNNGSKAVDYTIYLDDNTISDTDTRIDDKYLKYNLNKNGADTGATLLTRIGANPNRILDSGTIEGEGTNTYSLNLWITDEVDGNYSGQVFSGKLRVEVSQERPLATDTILAKANPEDLDYNSATSEQQKEMWTFSHPATEQTEALTDYRYIGTDPNNYVAFNDEIWRIIGVFTVDDGKGNMEQRIKLIRNEAIGNYSWDNKDDNWGKNNWADARLNYLLNEGHENESIGGSLYWNSENGICYSGTMDATLNCDFTNSGLKDDTKSMIGNALWYLGGTNAYRTIKASLWYSYERGTTAYTGRNISWIGKVGLMYPSDYSYATSGGSITDRNSCLNENLSNWSNLSDCVNNDWLYSSSNQWTITPNPINSANVLYLHFEGSILTNNANARVSIRPVVFLKSNIKISKGDGSRSNPYVLAL